MERLKPTRSPATAPGALPDGDAIYAAALMQATTTNFTPDEVHQLGLAQVAEISAQLDTILKGAGFTSGTVGERLNALNTTPAQLYPNTDEGRAALLASLNEDMKAMYAKLPQAFATLPTQPLEIRRVPVEIQDGASNGYYRRAALDGSRPAIYFINLKDTGDWPKYSLPALTYHEGVPGHHLQISLAQESKDIPTLRKIGGFSAYSEGWALYAEQVADELGGYEGIERAGYLQSFLFRAARLVVDTGLHSKRWSREQAIDYMVADHRLRPPARPARGRALLHRRWARPAATRSATWPGRVRAPRRRRRWARSSTSSEFHEVLKEGAMPLTILERRIDERVQASCAELAVRPSAISATSSQRSSAASISARWRAIALGQLRRTAAGSRANRSGSCSASSSAAIAASSRSISRRQPVEVALVLVAELPVPRRRPGSRRRAVLGCSALRSALGPGLRRGRRRMLAVPLPHPILIAAGDHIDLARPVEPERHRHRPVEEVAVVADDQHRPVIIGDHFLQQVERFQIEIVGRLVEHQQVRCAREFARQQQPRPLAARQRADRRLGQARVEQDIPSDSP